MVNGTSKVMRRNVIAQEPIAIPQVGGAIRIPLIGRLLRYVGTEDSVY